MCRDYDEMEKVMEVLPDDVMHVRHYQGHWYKNNNLLDSMEEKEAPLNPKLMDTVRNRIVKSKQSIYQKAKEAATTHGVEWITPLDRPAQYHGRVNP